MSDEKEGVMKRLRILALSLLAALVLATAGCAGGPVEAPGGVQPSAEETETPKAQYSASVSSGGAAVGAELQRTADWKLGCRAWVMSVSGKADLNGEKPHLAVVAVGPKNLRKTMWAMSAATVPTGAEQGLFVAPIPPGTTTLEIRTTLRSKDATGEPAVLSVPLAEVPIATALAVEAP